jgi:hypothetical protein
MIANPHWRIPRCRMKRKQGKQDQFVSLSIGASKKGFPPTTSFP